MFDDSALTVPVSVVIPAYRAGCTLSDAINSVRRQTRQPIEVIVVDDASGDDTSEIARSIESSCRPGWLKVITLPRNVGAGEARNVGWNAAIGTHIAFLDADDSWHPKKLELQWKAFLNQRELVLCGHGFRFSWDPDADPQKLETCRLRIVSRLEILLINPFVTPSVMVRRDAALRFQPGRRHMEDHLLWMEYVLAGHATAKLEAPLAILGKHQFGAGGLSGQLWAMESGDLRNYWQLRQSRHIGTLAALMFSIYSLIKFSRRLLIVGLRFAVGRLRATHPSEGL